MNADSGIDKIMLRRQVNSTVQRAGTCSDPDSENGFNPTLTRTGEHLITIRIEPLTIEMRVGINKHVYSCVETGALARLGRVKLGGVFCANGENYFNLVPT